MSQKADKNWGRVWSREAEMDCRVAMQHLAGCVFNKWRRAIEQERYPDMVGMGQIHDFWNMMYEDMQAVYTLERLVNDDYRAKIIEDEYNMKEAEDEPEDDDEDDEDNV